MIMICKLQIKVAYYLWFVVVSLYGILCFVLYRLVCVIQLWKQLHYIEQFTEFIIHSTKNDRLKRRENESEGRNANKIYSIFLPLRKFISSIGTILLTTTNGMCHSSLYMPRFCKLQMFLGKNTRVLRNSLLTIKQHVTSLLASWWILTPRRERNSMRIILVGFMNFCPGRK